MKEKSFGLDLAEGRISTLLLRFSAPFLLANLVNALYGIISMIIVGQFTNGAVLSGVANGSQVLNVMGSFIIGLGTGVTVLIGRCIGAKDDKSSAKAMGSTLVVSGAIIVLITAFVWAMSDTLLGILNTQPEALPSARRFIQICTIGVPFNIGYGMLGAVSRGMGNSKTPGVIAAVCCVINVGLSYLFVGLFGLGVTGAAISTAAAQFISFAAMAVWLYRKKLPFTFTTRDIRPDGYSTKRVLIVGMPLVLQELLITISFMIVTWRVNSISVEASAAVGVGSRILGLSVIVPMAMSSAISAISAQSIGAGKPERAMITLRWGILYSLVFAFLLTLACQIWPSSVAGLFTNDSVVIEGAANYLTSFILESLTIAFIFCANAYLSACGKSSVSMAHIVGATIIVRVPLSLYFTSLSDVTPFQKLHYLGFAGPIASLFSLVFCIFFITWYNKRLVTKATLPATPR